MTVSINEQVTFVIIKPDAIERQLVGEIISRIEHTYLRLNAIQTRHKTPEWAKRHYAHLVEHAFYPALEEFMTQAPLIGFVVHGPNAVARVRQIVGATRPLEAAPGTIRGDYGYDPPRYNLIHASDSVDAAEREIGIFYDCSTDRS